VLGWLGFVFVAFAIGSRVGVVTMTISDNAIGDSGAADRILAREFPTQRSLEEVLIQRRDGGRLRGSACGRRSTTLSCGCPERRGGVDPVAAAGCERRPDL
jgi:hypothetical protein